MIGASLNQGCPTCRPQLSEHPTGPNHPQSEYQSVVGNIRCHSHTKVQTRSNNRKCNNVVSVLGLQITLWCSVSIPAYLLTLSKQTRLSWPHMLILWGLMQKMPTRFRRRWAYTMPAVMAAGKAGGTVMVMMSRDSMMMVLAETWTAQRRNCSTNKTN